MHDGSSPLGVNLWSHMGSSAEYSELNTGDWWWQMENNIPELALPNHYLAPLILFINKTHLDQKGRLQAEPVLLELGNLSLWQWKKDGSKLMLGMVPTYPKTQEEKKEDRSSKETDTKYMEQYHKCNHIRFD